MAMDPGDTSSLATAVQSHHDMEMGEATPGTATTGLVAPRPTGPCPSQSGSGAGAAMCTPLRVPLFATPRHFSVGRRTALSRPQLQSQPTTPTKASLGSLPHCSVTTQQSPTAKTRLSSLVASIHRDHRRNSQSAMAEALLGLAPSYGSASSNKPSIAHPDDLPAQLRRELERKKTPTRCEHLSVTLEVPSTLEFAIREGDSDAQENVDPALSNLRTQVVKGQPVKIVRAYNTIISQPHDNPVMQRAVAKHIVGLLSVVDESTWVVREVSRGQYGWSFTYNCKDSLTSWNRQHQKTPNKTIIAEYSQKELEPIMQARPAFDCRGTLTVAFSKNSRTINVKYEHTPLHKTLGDMIEHFKPLPPAAPPAPLIPAGEKSKKAKTPRKRKSEALNADGTPVQPKRKRKSEAVNENETPVQPKKRKKKKSEAAKDSQAAGDATNGPATATVPTKADAAVQSGVHSHAVLNVPPGEAARRREVAIRLLSDSGLDPESLSTEQFGIFANQSPDLQKDSLAMLVKYGAERLRIVHPNDAAASSTSASPTPQQPAVEAGAPAAMLGSAALGKKKRPRKSKAAAEDAEEVELIPAPPGTPMKQISRGSCIACRRAKTKVYKLGSLGCREANRVQCNRAKPECASCEEKGVECQYPLIRKMPPKKKEEKSAALVHDDDDDEADADAEAEPEAEPEPTEPEVESEEQEPDDIETIDYTSNMPVANMLTPAAEAPNQDYFNAGPSELTYTQSASNDLNMSHGVPSYSEPSAPVNYAEQQAVSTSFSQPSVIGTATYTQPSTDTNSYINSTSSDHISLNYAEPVAKSPRGTRVSSRRSLPSGTGEPQQPAAESPVPLPSYAQNWQSMSPPRVANTVSPTMAPKQHRPRRSTQMPAAATVDPQETSYRSTQQTAAHVAVQQRQQHRLSPTQQAAQVAEPVTHAQVSPFQAPVQAARAKSRAGQRASTRTPVNEPRATPSHHTVQPSTSATMDSATYNDTQSLSNVANYNSYDAKYSNQSNNSTEMDTTRLAYQPYAAQNTSAATSTYPSYDYDRTNTTASHTSSSNARSGQLYNTQSHSRNAQSYDNTHTTAAAKTYAQQPSTTQQQSSSLQSFNMRSSAASSNQPRSSSRNNNQQPQQQQSQSQKAHSYGSYATQTQQQQQQQQSAQPDQQNWYGFGAGSNTSFTPANVSGGYATKGTTSANYGNGSSTSSQAYQQQHGSLNMSGHNYATSDNEMYELLKNSLHGSGR
ncbi:hypothetical protein CORC01_09938 [Colletotrichum orchidophilum]|uniref:Zn(2)-C6 fungal-type domain-containing protein n=1 Tax=Colletotrichum orchidophilum TaxID=1209926 RepID=A0A1G4B015_9PEZI|nr:uncharacterized protein CORC01_09938 [Colletotrichum orchidophilum]OHE94721.1 hypothetical protein CORC01_09938 [Colletotrichum orchidophilum]